MNYPLNVIIFGFCLIFSRDGVVISLEVPLVRNRSEAEMTIFLRTNCVFVPCPFYFAQSFKQAGSLLHPRTHFITSFKIEVSSNSLPHTV